MRRVGPLILKGVLLIGPPLLVLGLYLEGRVADPAYSLSSVSEAASAFPFPDQVDGWTLESPEIFPRERIYEKINGKMQYYEQFDVQRLYCATWTRNNEAWDCYAYEFVEPPSAFGAYVGERPPGAVDLSDVTGYSVSGMAAAVGGIRYVQLVAQTPQADPQAILALLTELVPDSAPRAADAEAPLTPAQLAGSDAVPDSVAFFPENAFGHAALQDAQAVRVSLPEGEGLWFSARGNAQAIAAFARELQDYGAEELFEIDGAQGGNMFGTWEMVGLIDGELWGVAQAPDRVALLAHWNLLKERRTTP